MDNSIQIHLGTGHAKIGFKYFQCENTRLASLRIRGKGKGAIEVAASENGPAIGSIELNVHTKQWQDLPCDVALPDGKNALFFIFKTNGSLDLQMITLA